MSLIKSLFLKVEVLLVESRIPQIVVCGVTLVELHYFESIGLSLTINIQHNYIHRVCEKVFRCINYRKNTVEMALFQKYEVFYKEIEHCLRFFNENIILYVARHISI